MAWYIRYGLGGGFGGCGEWERTDATNEEDAISMADDAALVVYESYGGLHGLFDEDEFFAENPHCDEVDADEARHEDIDTWIVYEAMEADCSPED